MEIISSFFSDHNAMGLEINYEKKIAKPQTLEAKNRNVAQ